MNALRGRGLLVGVLVMTVSVTACSVDRSAVAGSAAAPAPTSAPDSPPPKTDDDGSALRSATLEASPLLPSPDPAADARAALDDPDLERPALEYPNLQSYGAVVISFSSPDWPAITRATSCLWEPGGEYSDPAVRALQRFSIVLAGEQAEIWMGRPMTFGHSLEFAIHRHGAASYVAGLGTGSVEYLGVATDWSSGAMRFDDLAPSPATARPLGVSLAHWLRPLGVDPAMAALRGTVKWACDSPPELPSQEEISCNPTNPPNPFCLGDPAPITLVVDDQRQGGANLCGGFAGDTCGPRPYALPADFAVTVRTGHSLRFELPDGGSHFVRWSLEWAAQDDAERYEAWEHSLEPVGYLEEPWHEIDNGVLSESSVLEFTAPPPGDWSLQLGWTDDRADEGGNIASLFRVVVVDD